MRREAEEVYLKLGFTIRRYQVYVWFSMMHLLPEVWNLSSTTLHALMYICLVGAPHHMISPFSMFQYGR